VRLFTLAEANALLPRLRERFACILQLRAALRTTHRALSELGVPPAREMLDDLTGTPDVIREKGKFKALYEQLAAELAEAQALGVQVKDLDTGLCDFPALRGGREVLLCWRLGEPEITHWHTLESGFSGRQPL
jgi:hypothetical protein